MSGFISHLQVRPHGDRLLTSSAAFWFFSIRVLVVVMATAEAIGWSYLGYLFAEGAGKWISAVFVGVVVFLVIWMVDVSLVVFDRASDEHAQAILNSGGAPRTRKIREILSFTLRAALVVGSLTITAPYLAQVVFHRDIDRFITTEASTILENARREVSEKYDFLIQSKEKEISAKRSEHEQEVAGKGPSGRYGEGPAAKSMAKDILALENERDGLIKTRDDKISTFDELAKDWSHNRERLSAEYGIVMPQQSILENRKALEYLRTRPENHSIELAIKAFLGLIFTGLILLKLFEPRSVRYYLSEVLQQEYGRYLAGTFDELLPLSERSTAPGYVISPQRFYEFLVNVWVPMRKLDEHQKEANARNAAVNRTIDVLHTVQAQIEAEILQIETKIRQLHDLADEENESLTQLQSAIETVNNDVDAFQSELREVNSAEIGLDDKSRLEYRSIISAKLSEADRALHELREAVPLQTAKSQRANLALKQNETAVTQKRAELTATQDKLRRAREMVSESAAARAHELLGKRLAV